MVATYFRGGELAMSSCVFVGSLMQESDEADGEGKLGSRLQAISEKFLSRLRVKHPDRPLDIACLDANDRVHRAGTDAVDFTEFPLMGAVKFLVCDVSAESIARVAASAQVIRMVLEQMKVRASNDIDSASDAANEAGSIATELRENFPQPSEMAQKQDVLYLAVHLINMPKRTNVYVYSEPDDKIICAQRQFRPSKDFDSIEKIQPLLKWVDAGAEGAELCQRDR